MSRTSSAPLPVATRWLAENGPKALEQLLRTILLPPSAPILVGDDDGRYRNASVKRLNDFAEAEFERVLSDRWHPLLKENEGTLQFIGMQGDVECIARASHYLSTRGKSAFVPKARSNEINHDVFNSGVPANVRDFAPFLLDACGHVVTWYEGAERIYGYQRDHVLGQHVAFLYPAEDVVRLRPNEELKRADASGHLGNEGWRVRSDGSRFWANVITVALKDESGKLQGFARVVRDFSDRHQKGEKAWRSRPHLRALPAESTIASVVSGVFDRVTEANDAFLDVVGYSPEDLRAGRLCWADLTPAEYAPLDELAHEEGLRFGACTPFEKELKRKDGTRVPVMVTTAVLKLCPFRWITFVQDLRERSRLESVHRAEVTASNSVDEIIGNSPTMARTKEQLAVVAPTDANVLILGETGTGKELIARAIHRISPRRGRPFITLNCAAIPTGLLESELFGYERGAFTGALSQKIGKFEMAHLGTLFLDEVGDIPLDLQPKLLRALQEKSFERLGGTKTIPIDVRLLAATNRNLTQMLRDKLFRSDLYYRLNVFPIAAPSLRDHEEDIPVLARHFTKKFAARMDRAIERIPSETMRALTGWGWPGNVRELENFIERSVILSRGATLCAPVDELHVAIEASSDLSLEEVRRDLIRRVFRETGGVISDAAVRLGIPRTTLNAMMKKLNISRDDL